MHINLMNDDTICALATAPGMGAIAVVRLSGRDSHSIACSIFCRGERRLTPEDVISHKAYYGHIHDDEGFLDEVLMTFFKAPHSYTGEDSVEISIHGSPFIQQRLLELLFSRGSRMADAGEFTMRAFAHHRFDLAQAEAVADLIASRSKAAHHLAANQMRGGYSDTIKKLRQQLIDFTALIELELDFAEEEVEFADRSRFFSLLTTLKDEIQRLIDSFQAGNAIKNGIPTAIIGKPNVGKSTLLNAILNEDKAIVSDIPGTTRDSIEDLFVIKGHTFRFIDTAGLRNNSDDAIENLGIERSYEKMKQASIILYVADATSFDVEELSQFQEQIHDNNKHFILVLNKTDKAEAPLSLSFDIPTISISAKHKDNLDALVTMLYEIGSDIMDRQDTVVSNARHVQALNKAMQALSTVEEGLRNDLPTDLAAIDLHVALEALSTITGDEITNDEVLKTIFSKFCIGK